MKGYGWIAATATALLLAACGGGGGGGSANLPASVPAPAASPTASAPPQAANRTVVGTTTLQIVLPHTITAKTSSTSRSGSAGKRAPSYVNPTSTNLLDIYVDNSLVPNIDGVAGPTHSFVLSSATLSTNGAVEQVPVPLFSSQQNQVVVLEWDSSFTDMLAIGELNLGSFAQSTGGLGSTLTMQMNATGIGIVEWPSLNSPQIMNNGSYVFDACPSPSQFAIFPADATGTFPPTAGLGGTALATIYNTAPTGLTSVATSGGGFVPVYTVTPDISCDPIQISTSAINPASTISSDITNNYNTYSAYYPNLTGGPNQGIWNLVNEFSGTYPSVSTGISQINTYINATESLSP